MTSFLLPVASLLLLTLLAWRARSVLGLAVCPICLGVSATWLWMLAARQAGAAVDTTMLALLLGASVVGGAQWVQARLPPRRSPLLWKALAIPAGCIAAYGLVAQWWVLAAAAAAAAALLAALFLRAPQQAAGDAALIAQLEERMKQCC